MEIILGIFTEGLAYAVLSLGVYLTYRILDFPDLSVDGTFPLGAAVTAGLLTHGVSPMLAIPAAILSGAVFGTVTGILHVKCKIRDLLSGIIVMTALYSVNLRIAGKSNVPLFSKESIFRNPFTERLFPDAVKPYKELILLVLIVSALKILLDFYLKTKSGFLLRAVGDNEKVVTALGKDPGNVKILGLSIANALAALAGSIYCQMNGFFEVSMGTGTVVIGLSNVIIGMGILKKLKKLKPTTVVVAGSVLYKACVSGAILLGMAASDLKLVTAVFLFLILAMGNVSKKKGGEK